MTRAVKGSAKHPALRVHPWAPGLFAEILKARFPWLGTDKSIDYMDECCTLADLYKELQAAAKYPGGKVAGVPAFNAANRDYVTKANAKWEALKALGGRE